MSAHSADFRDPGPRKGVLALLDGSTFDKGKLPPIPESATGFTVMSLDLKTTIDKLVALAKTFKPDAGDQVDKMAEALKAKSKLRLKEDILAHVGPKVAWYLLPAKAGASAAPAAMPNMLGAMMAGVGMDQVPKLAVVCDIDDAKAFGKVLDELMAATNRELKAQAAKGPGDEAAAKGSQESRGPSGRAFVRVPPDARRDQDVRPERPSRACRPVPPDAPPGDPGRAQARGARRLCRGRPGRARIQGDVGAFE